MRVALTAGDFNGYLLGQRNNQPAEQDGTAKKPARGLALQVISKVKVKIRRKSNTGIVGLGLESHFQL